MGQKSDEYAEEICDFFIASGFIFTLTLSFSILSPFKLYFLLFLHMIYFFLSKGFYLLACGFLYFIKCVIYILIKETYHPHEVPF